MFEFAEKHGIPHRRAGKLIVATDAPGEKSRLEAIYQRSLANAVPDIQWLSKQELRQKAPNVVGEAAIWSPHTGIIDYGKVTEKLSELFIEDGGEVITNFQVKKFSQPLPSQSRVVESLNPIEITSQTGAAITTQCCHGVFSRRVHLD